LERQEIKKWEQGAIKASENKEYRSLCKELENMGSDLYEY